jgi:hypothetical protein
MLIMQCVGIKDMTCIFTSNFFYVCTLLLIPAKAYMFLVKATFFLPACFQSLQFLHCYLPWD